MDPLFFQIGALDHVTIGHGIFSKWIFKYDAISTGKESGYGGKV